MISTKELAKQLGYKDPRSITRLYKRNKSKFTEKDTVDGRSFTEEGVQKIVSLSCKPNAVQMSLQSTQIEEVYKSLMHFLYITQEIRADKREAYLAAAKYVFLKHGVNLADLISSSMDMTLPPVKDDFFSVSEIADLLGISPAQVNTYLADAKYQFRTKKGEWFPSLDVKSCLYRRVSFIHPNMHTGVYIKWDLEFVLRAISILSEDEDLTKRVKAILNE
jgi:hypothetical protein